MSALRAASTSLSWALLLAGTVLFARPAAASPDNFESSPVHPIELTPDGARLVVAHTADASVVVFDATTQPPTRLITLPVGLEPVSVRARTATELWVVNHVSDSISILDLVSGNVVRVLSVGDEPTDVLFAHGRAFVCVSREAVLRVFDLSNLDAPPIDLPLPQCAPRSLELSPDGARIYVAAFESGNRTTALPGALVTAGGGPPPPNPPMDLTLPTPPEVALIVQHDGLHWRDELGRDWDAFTPYLLADADVIEIDVASLLETGRWSGVGTSLFDLAVIPSSGEIWVSNLEAMNQIRFERNLRGRFVDNRVTRIDPTSGLVTPVGLNPHVDHGDPEGNPGERALSLALPLDLAVRADGSRLFVAAQGSNKVGVLDQDGIVLGRIQVGEGPCGLALDEARDALYVYNRFSSSVSCVDLSAKVVSEVSLGFDPSSAAARHGRKDFYGAETNSAHGDVACASCHLFAGSDGLAWDLGDPQGEFIPPLGDDFTGFHPMKGPMVTQPLAALEETEPLHWRGDRGSLEDFNSAFVTLMGRTTQLSQSEFAAMVDFLLTIRQAPNPFRALDGGLLDQVEGADPARGGEFFRFGNLTEAGDCAACHTGPTGESGNLTPGFVIGSSQDLDIPQLRAIYRKRGFDEQAAVNLRGFGFTHDGAQSLDGFLRQFRFKLGNDALRADITAFLVSFDTNTHAAVGVQWTARGGAQWGDEGDDRMSTLLAEASEGSIGLIAKGLDESGLLRGWFYDPSAAAFVSDRMAEPLLSWSELRSLAAPGREITFTAVVSDTEVRLGIDRDTDGVRDRDERDAGTDPNDPLSFPDVVAVDSGQPAPREARLEVVGRNPAVISTAFRFTLPSDEISRARARLRVLDVSGRSLLAFDLRSADRSLDRTAVATELTWDLRDARGVRVPAGVYFVRLETETAAATSALTRKIVVAR